MRKGGGEGGGGVGDEKDLWLAFLFAYFLYFVVDTSGLFLRPFIRSTKLCSWVRHVQLFSKCLPSPRCINGCKYRIIHGKCARTMFTHELWRIRNQTSGRSERVRFLIQNNECVNTVQSTFHVVLCLLYTY